MTDPRRAVAVRNLGVVYQRGGEPAAQGVTFELGPGEGLLLAGAPGAGKTSVLRAVLGLVIADGGIEVLGGPPGDPARLREVGYAPQGRRFPEGHTPRALTRMITAIRQGRSAGAVADDALTRAGLPRERWDSRTLELEELRRLAFACAIAGNPDLLVLDDPWEFPETVREIERARERGAAVLAASHDPGGLPAILGRTITLVDGSPA